MKNNLQAKTAINAAAGGGVKSFLLFTFLIIYFLHTNAQCYTTDPCTGVYMARAIMGTTIEFNMPKDYESVGINAQQQFVIYPNPAHNFITLKYLNGRPITDIYSIEICNAFGKVVKTIFSTANTIDISFISNGIYLIKVKIIGGEKFSVKLEILK